MFEVTAAQLRTLALTIVSVLRYVDGSWSLDDLRDGTLRYDLDALAGLHGQPLLGQRRPFHTRVRLYVAGNDPLQVDPTAIRVDLAARYVDQDCSFDLLVLTVQNGAVAGAYLYPWALFASGGPNWKEGIDIELFRTDVPDDIRPEHLR